MSLYSCDMPRIRETQYSAGFIVPPFEDFPLTRIVTFCLCQPSMSTHLSLGEQFTVYLLS